jgi:hypothetical protein
MFPIYQIFLLSASKYFGIVNFVSISDSVPEYMITSVIMELPVYPAIYFLWKKWKI